MEDTLAMHSSPSESCQWRWRHSTLVRSSEDCWHCTRAWGKRWDILQPWLQIFEGLHALCSSFWLVAVIHKTFFFSTRMQGSIFSSFLPMSLMLHWICAEYPFPSPGQTAFIYMFITKLQEHNMEYDSSQTVHYTHHLLSSLSPGGRLASSSATPATYKQKSKSLTPRTYNYEHKYTQWTSSPQLTA